MRSGTCRAGLFLWVLCRVRDHALRVWPGYSAIWAWIGTGRHWLPEVVMVFFGLACTAAALGAQAPEPASPQRPDAQRVVLVDGPAFEAGLVAADRQWQLTFRDPDGNRRLPAQDLVRFGMWRELARGPLVLLADGSLLAAEVLSVNSQHVVLDWRLGGEIKVARELVRAVALQPPAERLRREELLDALLEAPARADQLLLVNGDQGEGTLESLADRKLRFFATLGPIELELGRVRALVLHPELRPSIVPPSLRAVAGFRDGSRLVVETLRIEQGHLEAITLGGLAVRTPAEALVALQPLGGRVTYLSDLMPAEYRHVPYLNLSWPFRRDRNVRGGWLRAGGRLYLKGLGVHSAARLTYRLEPPCRRFEAELAIDDHTAGRGSVGFRVFVDGQPRYTSPPVRGGQAPLPVAVDLTGAKRLDLVVDFGEGADVLDDADWLDARLVR